MGPFCAENIGPFWGRKHRWDENIGPFEFWGKTMAHSGVHKNMVPF